MAEYFRVIISTSGDWLKGRRPQLVSRGSDGIVFEYSNKGDAVFMEKKLSGQILYGIKAHPTVLYLDATVEYPAVIPIAELSESGEHVGVRVAKGPIPTPSMEDMEHAH